MAFGRRGDGTPHRKLLAASRDHIVPRSVGGSDEPDNLLLAHCICNAIRGDGPVTDDLRDRCNYIVGLLMSNRPWPHIKQLLLKAEKKRKVARPA
jgi:hypothetical protein